MSIKKYTIIQSLILLLALHLTSCFGSDSPSGESTSASKQVELPINHPPINGVSESNLNNISNTTELLASRIYIRSFLNEVFYDGTSASAVNLILDKYLGSETEDGISGQANYSNMIFFGGPCDYYSEAGTQKACNYLSSNLTLPVYSPSTPSRESERSKICIELANNNTILSAGLNKISLNTSSPVTDSNIQSAFELFYPGHTLDSNSLTAFKNLNTEMQVNNETSIEKWRMIFFTLCQSPDWQVL